jgi:hypothetical protein
MVECNISRKMEWTLRADCVASWSLDLTLMDFFQWRHLKEHVYAVPPRTVKDIMTRLQAAVAVVIATMFKMCLREYCMVHCLAICLEMDRGDFETYCNHEVPMV